MGVGVVWALIASFDRRALPLEGEGSLAFISESCSGVMALTSTRYSSS